MIAKFNKQGGVRFFDIRKFTPKECFRLMGCPEWAVEKLTAEGNGLSRSAMYKLAGNSIVCNVLYWIYRKIWFNEHDYTSDDLFQDEWKVDAPDKVKMLTLCSGYDAQCIAMDMLKEWARIHGRRFDYELLAWSEFDPESNAPLERQPAVIAHNILYPQWADRNLGDMTKADYSQFAKKDLDLLTYSTPCQSISLAGKREGMQKGSGTRSSILFYTENAIRQMRPKFLLQENVAAILNKTNKADFDEWCRIVEDCGYTNYYTLLNAKDYGVPQNRLRMFMLSVRNDLGLPGFSFPKPFELGRTIADEAVSDADQSYFVKAQSIVRFLYNNERDEYEYRVVPSDLEMRIKAHCERKSEVDDALKAEPGNAELLAERKGIEAEKAVLEGEARELLKEPYDFNFVSEKD